MLKTVSSVANALGALNYKGTWNASTNTPTLASGVGTQGDYYVVSVAGTTDLDGITNWGPGDWATFNGSVWQRVEGGADGNFDNLTANSLTVTGEIEANGGIALGDSDKATFGASDDLQIYHDGTDSFITNTAAGNLFINDESTGYVMMKGSDLYFRNPSNADMIHAQSSGFVKLYHNGAEKLSTTATGIDVTGTATMDGLTVDPNTGLYTTDATLSSYSSANGVYLNGHAGGWLSLRGDGTGATRWSMYGGATGDVTLHTANKQRLRVDGPTGDISFYEDTGTTPSFLWTSASTSLSLTGAEASRSSNSYLLDIDNSAQTSNVSAAGPFRIAGSFGDSLIVTGRGDVSLFNESGAAKFFWDASAESLGIGTSSPATDLHIKNASATQLLLESGNTDTGFLLFGDADDLNVGSVSYNHSDNSMRFETDDSEAMRIENGNVLVGTTSAVVANSASNVGTAIGAGLIESARAGVVAQFNRHSTDGSIIDLQKAGASIGSIGTDTSDLTIYGAAAGHTGLRFGNGEVYPTNNAGSLSDNTMSLGSTSVRFKDLYLSSGVYLGGTGASNLLDDYEFGTWTPVFADDPIAGNTATMTADGRYTKIGRVITVECRMLDINTTGMTAGNNIFIRGLPESLSVNSRAIGSVSLDRVNFTNYVVVKGGSNASYALLSDQIDSAQDAVLTVASILATGSDITFTLQYTV